MRGRWGGPFAVGGDGERASGREANEPSSVVAGMPKDVRMESTRARVPRGSSRATRTRRARPRNSAATRISVPAGAAIARGESGRGDGPRRGCRCGRISWSGRSISHLHAAIPVHTVSARLSLTALVHTHTHQEAFHRHRLCGSPHPLFLASAGRARSLMGLPASREVLFQEPERAALRAESPSTTTRSGSARSPPVVCWHASGRTSTTGGRRGAAKTIASPKDAMAETKAQMAPVPIAASRMRRRTMTTWSWRTAADGRRRGKRRKEEEVIEVGSPFSSQRTQRRTYTRCRGRRGRGSPRGRRGRRAKYASDETQPVWCDVRSRRPGARGRRRPRRRGPAPGRGLGPRTIDCTRGSGPKGRERRDRQSDRRSRGTWPG